MLLPFPFHRLITVKSVPSDEAVYAPDCQRITQWRSERAREKMKERKKEGRGERISKGSRMRKRASLRCLWWQMSPQMRGFLVSLLMAPLFVCDGVKRNRTGV